MNRIDSGEPLRDLALSRRQLLTGAAAIGGVALSSSLAGCAPTRAVAGAGLDQLKYWSLFSGGDGINMNNLVQQVNAADRQFQVTQTVLAWGTPYYTKLAMASAGGRGPDVAIMHASRIAGYAPGGLLDDWDTARLAKYGVSESDWLPAMWKKGHSGGRLFALPLDSHPYILMYNPEILGKAQLLGSDGQIEPITSAEHFLEVGRAIQGVTGKHGVSFGYLGDGPTMWRMFYTLYRQQGADFVLTPGTQAQVDMDASVKALEFIRKLLDDKIATSAADTGAAESEFLNRQTGILFSGVWSIPTLVANKVPFDACPIPTLFDTPASYADSHTFVLPHQSNVDERKREDVYRFVAQLLKDSGSWSQGGHIPAFLPVTTSAAAKAELPQAHYASAADHVNYDPSAWFTGAASDFQNYFGGALQNVYLGKEKPEVGMKSFIDRLNVLLSKPNPVA